MLFPLMMACSSRNTNCCETIIENCTKEDVAITALTIALAVAGAYGLGAVANAQQASDVMRYIATGGGCCAGGTAGLFSGTIAVKKCAQVPRRQNDNEEVLLDAAMAEGRVTPQQMQ